jgi:hypothetical protein
MNRKLLAVLSLSLMFTLQSCYVYTVQVGKGAQSGASVSKWNHYLLYGLAPVGVADPKAMAGDATDYTVVNKHSFVNGLVMGLTLGIYAPTTTIVKK